MVSLSGNKAVSVPAALQMGFKDPRVLQRSLQEVRKAGKNFNFSIRLSARYYADDRVKPEN